MITNNPTQTAGHHPPLPPTPFFLKLIISVFSIHLYNNIIYTHKVPFTIIYLSRITRPFSPHFTPLHSNHPARRLRPKRPSPPSDAPLATLMMEDMALMPKLLEGEAEKM
jgi:hypothetical protein